MTKKPLISVSQLFCMLFISRMVVNLTYNPLLSGGDSSGTTLSPPGFPFVLIFVLFIPIYWLYSRRPGLNLIDDAYFLLGRFGAVVGVVYGLYYLLVCCYTLSSTTFRLERHESQNLLLLLSIAVALSACYGAFKGIEALARTSGIIFFLILASMVFLICALVSEVNPINFTPVFYDGPEQSVKGVLLMLRRSSRRRWPF